MLMMAGLVELVPIVGGVIRLIELQGMSRLNKPVAQIRVAFDHADNQIGTGLAGHLGQSLSSRAGDIDGVGPIPLPGAATLGAAAADDCAEAK